MKRNSIRIFHVLKLRYDMEYLIVFSEKNELIFLLGKKNQKLWNHKENYPAIVSVEFYTKCYEIAINSAFHSVRSTVFWSSTLFVTADSTSRRRRCSQCNTIKINQYDSSESRFFSSFARSIMIGCCHRRDEQTIWMIKTTRITTVLFNVKK